MRLIWRQNKHGHQPSKPLVLEDNRSNIPYYLYPLQPTIKTWAGQWGQFGDRINKVDDPRELVESRPKIYPPTFAASNEWLKIEPNHNDNIPMWLINYKRGPIKAVPYYTIDGDMNVTRKGKAKEITKLCLYFKPIHALELMLKTNKYIC